MVNVMKIRIFDIALSTLVTDDGMCALLDYDPFTIEEELENAKRLQDLNGKNKRFRTKKDLQEMNRLIEEAKNKPGCSNLKFSMSKSLTGSL